MSSLMLLKETVKHEWIKGQLEETLIVIYFKIGKKKRWDKTFRCTKENHRSWTISAPDGRKVKRWVTSMKFTRQKEVAVAAQRCATQLGDTREPPVTVFNRAKRPVKSGFIWWRRRTCATRYAPPTYVRNREPWPDDNRVARAAATVNVVILISLALSFQKVVGISS